jgi:hypothetical protein
MGSIKRSVVGMVAASAAALVIAAPAHAGVLVPAAGACETAASERVFLPWLDLAHYVPAPGGAAESAAGWKLTGGAGVVAGNEPWRIGDAGDGSSLLLPRGSSATTATMCVGLEHPTMRFFARKASSGLLSTLSTLSVEVLFNGLGGTLESLPIGVVALGGGWQPTLPFPVVANLLPLLPGEQTPVAFRFTARGGAWQIDDVYVDPWKAR